MNTETISATDISKMSDVQLIELAFEMIHQNISSVPLFHPFTVRNLVDSRIWDRLGPSDKGDVGVLFPRLEDYKKANIQRRPKKRGSAWEYIRLPN